jgi:TonB-linked SusC/RagA family outer membrane protein
MGKKVFIPGLNRMAGCVALRTYAVHACKLSRIVIYAMLFVGLGSLSAKSDQRLTLSNHRGTLNEFFKAIERQSDYRFFYNDELVSVEKEIYQLDVKNKSVDEVLTSLLANTGLRYKKLDNNLIVISTLELLQSVNITGTIVDATGEPVIGANVFVKGSNTIGTITDIDGKFTLNVPDYNTVLTISYIGYATQEISVGTQRTFRIVLQEDNLQLDEVTVIAYGTTRKKDLIGSVSTIDAKTIGKQSLSTVTRALEGAVPGVQLSAVDGQPGMDMLIRVRGLGSANEANAYALIVVDGVPALTSDILTTINSKDIESVTVLKDAASTAMYGSRGANGVVLITTKKGTKGKAMVTYEGRFGVNQVSSNGRFDLIENPKDYYEYAWLSIYNDVRYKSSQTMNTNVQNPNMSDQEAREFASQHLFDYDGSTDPSRFKRNALGNWMLYHVPGAVYTPTGPEDSNDVSATMSGAYLVGTDGRLNPNAQLLFNDRYFDWYFVKRFRQEHNATISGANDKVDYFISTGFLDDPAYVRNAMFKRYSARGNVNAQVYHWLKAGINAAYSNRTTQMPATRYGRNAGAAGQNLFRWYESGNPLASVWAHNEDGSYKYDSDGNKIFTSAQGLTYTPLGGMKDGNPTGKTNVMYGAYDLPKLLEMDKDIQTSNDVSFRGYVEAKFLKNFSFTASVNQDAFFTLRHRYWNNTTGAAVSYRGALGETFQHIYNLDVQQLLKYDNAFGRHHVDVIAGHEFQLYRQESANTRYNNSLIPGFDAYANFVGFNQSSTFVGNGGSKDRFAMESYFGRANYSYDNKYYGEVSLRGDGSSKFKKPENRWGLFWSVGGGWRISSEKFMASTNGWLNDLKLRGSYGVIGNQNGLGYYSGYQTWGFGASSYTYSGNSWSVPPANYTLAIGAFPNDALTWENVHTLDGAIDFRLFDRISGTVEYYNRTTTNMIWAQPIAFSLGQRTLDKNTAKMNNYGVEAMLDITLIRNKDLFWSVNLNGTHYRSIIQSVPAGVGSGEDNTWEAYNGTFLRGEGKDFYNMYYYKYCGVDQQSGLALYQATVSETDLRNAEDNPNDARFNDVRGHQPGDIIQTVNYEIADRYEMGSATPDIIGGFGTTLQYKGFDLSALFSFQLGGLYLSNDFAYNLYSGTNGQLGVALSSDLLGNTWTPENTGAKFPIQMYSNDPYTTGCTLGSWKYTDMALFSASYLNMKNLTAGYTVPASLLSRIEYVSNLRVFVTLDNMYTLTAKKGVEPRMSLTGGADVGASPYPYMGSMSVGIDISF